MTKYLRFEVRIYFVLLCLINSTVMLLSSRTVLFLSTLSHIKKSHLHFYSKVVRQISTHLNLLEVRSDSVAADLPPVGSGKAYDRIPMGTFQYSDALLGSSGGESHTLSSSVK